MTSELSNALNPNITQNRSRNRVYSYDASYASSSTTTNAADVSQRQSYSHVPHRSELELAIIPPEPQPPARAPSPPGYAQTLTAMQTILQAVNSANEAAEAERERRLAWELEQETRYSYREADLQNQVAEMKSELLLLKASMSLQQRSPSQPLLSNLPPSTFEPPLPEPSAHIEEIVSPSLAEQRIPRPLIMTESLAPPEPLLDPPRATFVEGASVSPSLLSSPRTALLYPSSPVESLQLTPPSPALTNVATDPLASSIVSSSSPGPLSQHFRISESTRDTPSHNDVLHHTTTTAATWQLTALPSPAQSIISQSPRPSQEPTSRSLGKRRTPPSPPSMYDSASSDEDDPSPVSSTAPRKRKNGHDSRCLTIQHAMRDHMLRSMRIRHNEPLPESHHESAELLEDDPVRFVWEKTVKKCPHNARMKQRVLKDLAARRKRYKYVPDKDFDRKVLDPAFEQAFSTFRQKYKMQKDELLAVQHKFREEQKYAKVRRKERKKTKLARRTDRRQMLELFSHSTFDSALKSECMSSEESCDEYVEPTYPSSAIGGVQVLRVRGLSWRSSRLLRFYATLDAGESAEQAEVISNKLRRPLVRKERCIGPPKDGFIMPPQGTASWMISRRWVRENQIAHPDLEQLLKELVLDPSGFDWHSFDALGEESEDELSEVTERFIPCSDTSYSLAHALAPLS